MASPPAAAYTPWDDAAQFSELYNRLRFVARARMAGQAGHTLTPTSLVNEAMIRLLKPGENASFNDESHFVATASTAMRHILVDHARRKTTEKRNSGTNVSLEEIPQAEFPVQLSPETILDVSRVLDRIAETEPEAAKVIELRVFAGLTFPELGALLGVETKTAERRWRYAAAVLRSTLNL